MDDDLGHFPGHLVEWYEHMLVLDIKHVANVVPREQVQRNSFKNLLLGVVDRVVGHLVRIRRREDVGN